MITTDQLQADLSKLRDALEAFAFTFNSVVIQKGRVVLPTDEVTGEYLASLPVGLDTYERERSIDRSLAILSRLLENAWELYRREWGMAVGRHDQDPRPS